jgi:hypothetical protein
MNFFSFFFLYNNLAHNFNKIKLFYLNIFFYKTYFISNYYLLNELIWQEGLLIDFLQKKIADNWTKKFLIYSSYLFNEKLLFDKIIRFYLNLIIWPSHQASIFDFNNVSHILFITVFFFISITFIFLFLYFYFLLF